MPKNHEADMENRNKGTSGTNSTNAKNQGNRGKQLNRTPNNANRHQGGKGRGK